MKTNWLDRPWTTRSFLKFMGISTAISVGIAMIEIAWIFRGNTAGQFDEKINRTKKEPSMEEDP